MYGQGRCMMHFGGRIELIIGPMFAGKTTELMRRVEREMIAQRRCFIIKYKKDIRYSTECVASHNQRTMKSQAAVYTLAEAESAVDQFDVIAVDEGQFFPDLVAFCSKAADSGKTVIVSALDGDFRRQAFGHVCDLIPLCEDVMKLRAVCMVCRCKEAAFTRRTVDMVQQELIGGSDLYISTCRECYSKVLTPVVDENGFKSESKHLKDLTDHVTSPQMQAACASSNRFEPLSEVEDSSPAVKCDAGNKAHISYPPLQKRCMEV